MPGRTNIIVTGNKNWSAENTTTASSIEEAIKAAKETNVKEIFIAGGGEIYKQTLPMADRVYLTRVHTTIDGDAFFPEIDVNTWQIIFEKYVKADEKNKFDMTFQTWERK